MQVTGVAASGASSASSAALQSEEVLGKDAFLRLLITQIRFQDPLSPMEDREFIAQLAQLSALEQMQQMNTGFTVLQLMSAGAQALALVGRQITAQVPGEDHPLTGTVTGVSFAQGTPVLLVGEREIELSWVTEVR